MLDASRRASLLPGGAPIVLYKNNTDNKGASYGAHENYLMRRSTPFVDIVRHLTPFFVSRQVICGAGRVGIGQDGREQDQAQPARRLLRGRGRAGDHAQAPDHQHPGRAARRPEEAACVIIGDANLAEVSTYLKVGTTALVLAMIEDRFIGADLAIEGPVAALRAVSPDAAASQSRCDGRTLTAIQLRSSTSTWPRSTSRTASAAADPDDRRARPLGVDARPAGARPDAVRPRLDWVAKLKLLEQYRSRDNLAWDDDAKAQADRLPVLRHPAREGPLPRLVGLGRIERLLDDATVEMAMHDPPEDTAPTSRAAAGEVRRARRGRVVGLGDLRPPGRVAATGAHDRPVRGSKAHVGELLDRCDTAEALFAALTR